MDHFANLSAELRHLIFSYLDPANIIASRVQVLEDADLLYLIFSHLDPASVKESALVSR